MIQITPTPRALRKRSIIPHHEPSDTLVVLEVSVNDGLLEGSSLGVDVGIREVRLFTP